MLEAFKEWDRELLVFLNNLGTESFDTFWVFVTQIESWTALFIYFTILIFYFYGWKKGMLVFVFATLSFLVTLSLTEFSKEFFERLRPNNTNELSQLLRVLQHPETFSFFSGHASSSMAITCFVVMAIKPFNKWIRLAFIWPLLFAISRIYVGVHYPSDILMGALVGTSIAYLNFAIVRRLLPKS